MREGTLLGRNTVMASIYFLAIQIINPHNVIVFT